MKISILSGKGGTGKTTLSVNLFSVLDQAILVDTDTEEPNSHLFIERNNEQISYVLKNHPIVDQNLCTFCGKCGKHCNFNAIIPTKSKVLVFEDLCHDCGLCMLVCESGAISYQEKAIGTIYHSQENSKDFIYGKLNIGEVSGVRIIEALNRQAKTKDLIITDCPPGVSCSTVAALEDTDYAILCAEPTPFGISDMKMVIELLRDENINFGVVVNKSGLGNNDIYDYLHKEKIPLLEDIPWTKERAKIYSNGGLIINHDAIFKTKIENIITTIMGDYND